MRPRVIVHLKLKRKQENLMEHLGIFCFCFILSFERLFLCAKIQKLAYEIGVNFFRACNYEFSKLGAIIYLIKSPGYQFFECVADKNIPKKYKELKLK